MIRRNERASVSLPSFITICAIFRYVLRNNPKFMLLEYEVRKINVEKRYPADIDVGFGKTIIAILLLAAFAVNGYQTVLMAPTQALAQQHYEEVKERTKDLGLNTVMLGGRGLKTKEKEALLKEIQHGNADIIVGAHSVLSDSVTYHNLALVIADEEHKFGISQRETLISKAAAGVHSLTMSATPIPRSLARVLYWGQNRPDMISILD